MGPQERDDAGLGSRGLACKSCWIRDLFLSWKQRVLLADWMWVQMTSSQGGVLGFSSE